MRSWRPALRLARREARRSWGRSLIVVAMIGLPVAGIVAADVVVRTSDVSSREGLDRRLGAADAQVYGFDRQPVRQAPDPEQGMTTTGPPRSRTPLPVPSAAAVRRALGPGTRVVARVDGVRAVHTPAGLADPTVVEVDLRDPMTHGLYLPVSGRWPRSPDEVVVSPALVHRGIGARLRPLGGPPRRVVGVVESPDRRGDPFAVGLPGAFGLRPVGRLRGQFFVERPGGVSWGDVQRLNRLGMAVVSRQVITHPPPDAVTAEQLGSGGDQELTAAGLVVVMALLELTLLAGPALAVGARQRARTLALTSATGATPCDLRRTVLATGVALGVAGAATGAGLGVLVARLAVPVLEARQSERFGPFEVAPLDVLAVAAFGAVSALLAAAAPAWLAARQDVVAVLAGRRGEARPGRRLAALGAVLVLAGVAAAVDAARRLGGEQRVAAAAVLTVAGMVLLVPRIVAALARVAGALPLPARFAVRDAARHRSRTGPAVAAVLATVVGVTALGIGSSSDSRKRQLTHTPLLARGAAAVAPACGSCRVPWRRVRAAARRVLPGARVTVVRGPSPGSRVRISGAPASASAYLDTYLPVARGPVQRLRLPLQGADVPRANAALAAGGAVVFSARPTGRDEATIRVRGRRTTVPAAHVRYRGLFAPGWGVLSPEAAARAHVPVGPVGLVVDGVHIGTRAEANLDEAVRAVDTRLAVLVERGPTSDGPPHVLILALLGAVAAVLMLGGALTATALALSEARPDLATLAAVGADPRARRLVAAAYAGTIALLGAALGCLVGLVPGIAAARSMTHSTLAALPTGATSATGEALPGSIVVVPWGLLAAIVVGLPLLTAVVAGATSRSRLPMVARLR